MEQHVVRAIWANDKIAVRVVHLIAIEVMDFFWPLEPPPENTLDR